MRFRPTLPPNGLLVRGHTLRWAGAVRYDANGVDVGAGHPDARHAACICGHLSPPGLQGAPALTRRWHHQHKQTVTAAANVEHRT